MPPIAEHEGWTYVDEQSLRLPYSKAWVDYWRSRLDENGSPCLVRFDPLVDVPAMVHCIGWIEVLKNDYLYRVLGTTIRDQLGVEFTGSRLSEMDLGGFEAEVRKAFDGICADGQPKYMRGYYSRHGRRETNWEACMLPIQDNTGAVVRILLGMAYSKRF